MIDSDFKKRCIPQNKEVRKVSETKVLGLTMDKDLNFNSHSKRVYNKIVGKWAKICEYTSKHWGFNQRVITKIAQTFFLTSIHYAGIVWMNEKNMKQVEQIWYKIIKSAIGATFNIRKSLAEIILGMPPIVIQNQMNKVKFYLKINIKPAKEDRLRDFIKRCYEDHQQANIVKELKVSIRDVFRFLKWKLAEIPSDFTQDEIDIIQNLRYDQYFQLSTTACSYTKTQILHYTEKIWASKIENEFALDGYYHKPTPSCSHLQIPKNTTREQEVLLMSLFYPNNLFNSHIYRHTYQAESPLCRKCGRDEETPYHIILECSDLAEEAQRLLAKIISEDELRINDCITLLHGRKSPDFLKICVDILSQQEYRVHIDLNEPLVE